MYSFGISNILKVTQQTSEGGKRINYCNFAISYVEYYAASSPVPPFYLFIFFNCHSHWCIIFIEGKIYLLQICFQIDF